MAVALDDSIGKLQQFCQDLTRANGQLENDIGTVEEQADVLDALEDRAGEVIGGLADALEQAQQELGTAHDDARTEIDKLADLAEQVSGQRLGSAGDRLGAAEDAFVDVVNESQKELEDTQERLRQEGFDALVTALEALEGEVEGLGGETEGHFDGLTSGLEELGGDADEARSEVNDGLDEAKGGIEEDGQTTAEAAKDAASSWSDELDQEISQRCQAVGDGVESAYNDWEADVKEQADAWNANTTEAVEETTNFLVDETPSKLAEPMGETVETGGTATAEAEGAGVTALTEGEQVVDPLQALVPELEVVRRIVGDIDRLLNELG
jgi:chromosome segregation ATPase